MKFHYPIAMAAALFAATPALAADNGEALFNKHSCNVCHDTDKKGVGPALSAIAGKYRGDNSALAKLEKKMRSGGSGVWGSMPMPPVAQVVSNEELRGILQWILSRK